jgi:hypothetical protein
MEVGQGSNWGCKTKKKKSHINGTVNSALIYPAVRNIAKQWAPLIVCAWEMGGSGAETRYPDLGFSCVSSILPGKYRDNKL